MTWITLCFLFAVVQASFKKLIDDGKNGSGKQRLIPISFGLRKDVIVERCQHLNTHEILYFGRNYRTDKTNMTRLLNAIQRGTHLSDPNFRSVEDRPSDLGPVTNPTDTVTEKGSAFGKALDLLSPNVFNKT